MRLKYVCGFIVCLFLIITVSLPASCTAEPAPNLLVNGGFEAFDVSHRAIAWHKDYWNANSLMAVTTQKAHSGSYAAALQAIEKNDIRLIQSVPVEPNTIYQLSGWVATRGVSRGEAGANLSVLGGNVLHEGLTGDNDWTLMKFTFQTNPRQTRIIIGVRLGFYGQTATGTAYFDDIRLEKLSEGAVTYQQLDSAQKLPEVDELEQPQIDSPKVLQENLLASFKKWIPIIIFSLYFLLVFLGIRYRDSILSTGGIPELKRNLPNILMVLMMVSVFLKFFLLIVMGNWIFSDMFSMKANSPHLKLFGLILDSLTAWLLYGLFKSKNPIRAFLIAAAYLFLPAMMLNLLNGLENSLICCLVAGTFYLTARRQRTPAMLSAAALLLINNQGFFIGIPLICYVGFLDIKPTRFGRIVPGILTAVLILGLFRTLFLSDGIPNKAANLTVFFNWTDIKIGTLFNHDVLYNHGKLLFILLFGSTCSLWSKNRTRILLTLSCAWVGYLFFLFWPNGNEGGLLPVLTVLLIAFGFSRDLKLFYVMTLLGVSCLFNIYAIVMNPDTMDRIMYILSIVNTVFFGVFTVMALVKQDARNRKWRGAVRVYSRFLKTGLKDKLNAEPFAIVKRDYVRLGILILIYTGFLFANLGSWMTPQTGVDLDKPSDGVEIRFKKPTILRTLAYYDAEGIGNFELRSFQNGRWEKISDFSTQDYYVLKRKPLSVRTERLIIIPKPSAGHVNEIAFFDATNRLVPIRNVIELSNSRVESPKHHPLFDEQTRMSVKPSFLNSTYFDEIYHGRTAYEFVKGAPVYENTHPPLGKDILALGILMFGMNPFGMRFMHAVAGIFLIITLFFLGRTVLGTRFGAYGLMLLGMLDFMPYVQSRYSTIDTTSVLFITLMFLFAFRFVRQQIRGEKLTRLAGTVTLMIFFFTLAAATKWTAVYGSAGVFLIFVLSLIKRSSPATANPLNGHLGEGIPKRQFFHTFWSSYSWKRLLIVSLILFILIAPLIYFLTYLPYLHSSGIKNAFSAAGVREVIQNQRGMYDYHSQLSATHPFASAWWSWPFNFKPLWLYMDEYPPDGQKGTIASMGNPFIWFLSLVGLVVLFYQFIVGKRQPVLSYILICFAAQYLPWVLVARVSFIYHFYPVLPWFFICAVILIEPFWTFRRGGYRWVVYLSILTALAFLVAFHPALTGYDVPQKYIDFLRLFPREWNF